MEELRKVRRAAGKACPGTPHQIWLVVDATTGQNALLQARESHQTLGLTGLILTEMNSTAKGRVEIMLVEALQLLFLYMGVGEAVADLRPPWQCFNLQLYTTVQPLS